jgi:hypothetical protein
MCNTCRISLAKFGFLIKWLLIVRRPGICYFDVVCLMDDVGYQMFELTADRLWTDSRRTLLGGYMMFVSWCCLLVESWILND